MIEATNAKINEESTRKKNELSRATAASEAKRDEKEQREKELKICNAKENRNEKDPLQKNEVLKEKQSKQIMKEIKNNDEVSRVNQADDISRNQEQLVKEKKSRANK